MKYLASFLISLFFTLNAAAYGTMYMTSVGLTHDQTFEDQDGSPYAAYRSQVGEDEVVLIMFGYERGTLEASKYLVHVWPEDPDHQPELMAKIREAYPDQPILRTSRDTVFDATKFKSKKGKVVPCTERYSTNSGPQTRDTFCVGKVIVEPYYDEDDLPTVLDLPQYEGETVEFWYLEQEGHVPSNLKPTLIISAVLVDDILHTIYFEELP